MARYRTLVIAVALAALLGAAGPPAAGAAGSGFSMTPSKTEPYAVCGRPTPRHAECLAIIVPAASPRSPSAIAPALTPAGQPFAGSGVGGGYDPADLRSAYNLPSASAGSGQTVAIVDAFDDPKAESDLGVYRARYGLPECTTANGCFKKVNQTGGTKLPAANAGWAVEISLDLDMASAACPNCHLLLVEASSNSDANLYTGEDEAATLGASEISNSWGGEESSEEASEDQFFDHPGIPITVAAGDSGFEVEYPAASPDVIAVGGTALTRASNTRGWSETAWSGTGSGCSLYEPKPAWQTDSGCAKRTVNDVSAVASPSTPLSVADSYKLPAEFSVPEAGWTLVGGTSASSPLIAGTMALANPHTKSFAGADALYEQASQSGAGVLDDVLSGSNGSCGTYLCNAAAGYDGPTGLGSPYGAPFVAQPPIYEISQRTTPVGERVPYVSWGTLTFTFSTGTSVSCENAVGGWVETGGGREETTGWSAYNCKSEACEQAGGHFGVVFENEKEPQSNPTQLQWPGELTGARPSIKLAIANVKLYAHCQLAGMPSEERPGEGQLKGFELRVSSEANTPGALSCSAGTAGGSLTPKTSNFPLPLASKLVFTAGGELACAGGAKATTSGSLRISGFNGQEEITTAN
jgi:hypothetical protein